MVGGGEKQGEVKGFLLDCKGWKRGLHCAKAHEYHGRYMALAEYGGWCGFIIVPEGREGRG